MKTFDPFIQPSNPYTVTDDDVFILSDTFVENQVINLKSAPKNGSVCVINNFHESGQVTVFAQGSDTIGIPRNATPQTSIQLRDLPSVVYLVYCKDISRWVAISCDSLS